MCLILGNYVVVLEFHPPINTIIIMDQERISVQYRVEVCCLGSDSDNFVLYVRDPPDDKLMMSSVDVLPTSYCQTWLLPLYTTKKDLSLLFFRLVMASPPIDTYCDAEVAPSNAAQSYTDKQAEERTAEERTGRLYPGCATLL